MTTGQRIRLARKQAGMTQKELAAKLGISYVGVSQWERDVRNPKMETLQRIASAIGVRTDVLLGQDTFKEAIQSGIVSPADIANEMVMPVQLVWDVIQHPESVSPETADAVFKVGSMLAIEFSEFDHKQLKEILSKIYQCLLGLNTEGQQKAIERIEELTEIPKYQRQSKECP